MTGVWSGSRQSGGHLLLLLALADFADDRGECWPSIATLSDRARVTERHVRRLLREIEEAGEIVCIQNAGPHGCNRYRVVCLPGDVMKCVCPICDVTVDLDETHDHHVIPRGIGGNDRKVNRLRICVKCHGDMHHPGGALTELGLALKEEGLAAARKLRADKLSSGPVGSPTLTPTSKKEDAGVSRSVIDPPNKPPEDGVGEATPLQLESLAFVAAFLDLLDRTGAKLTPPTLSARRAWADAYEKLVRIDGKPKAEIWAVCRWAREDPFWSKNFFSPAKLREKKDGVSYFDRFNSKRTSQHGTHHQSSSRHLQQSGDYNGITDK